MPNKKKAVTSKKSTSTKKTATVKKEVIPIKKNKNKNKNDEATITSEVEKTVKKNGNKKTTVSQDKVKKITNSKTKVVNNSKKVPAKDPKKKTNKKEVSKLNNIEEVKEKSVEKINSVSNKDSKNKDKKKQIIKINLSKKEGKVKNNKIKESNKEKKTNILVKIKEKLIKSKVKKQDKPKQKKAPLETKKLTTNKTKKQQVEQAPIFTKTTKKWLIIVAVTCVIIILAEIGYLIYHQIDVDRHTTYYDSLNSLAIDDTDIVAVGSSNFKYSKYNDYTKGLEKAKFIKYDKNGKIIFEKMYKQGINTTFSSVISVNDGYVVVGSGEFSEQEQKDGAREAIIVKYDKEGNVVWEKYYQVVTNTRFNKVIATNDGYVAIGQSIYANMEMGNHTTGGGIIVKYDFDGNEVWHNNHGGMKSGNFNDIVEVNGDFYVVGKDATDSANLVKFDNSGQYKWHKNYSYTDGIGFTGIAYLDNALYVVGSKKILPADYKEEDSRDTTNTDALLVKYDLDGKVLFEKNFGGSNYERYNSILAYRNNLYIVGHTSSKDAGLKIDTNGELMTGILVRYDKNGNILKKESFGGSNNDNLTDIVTDSVSIYITAYSNSKDGNITTARNNGKDYFGKIIKLDFKFRTLMVK